MLVIFLASSELLLNYIMAATSLLMILTWAGFVFTLIYSRALTRDKICENNDSSCKNIDKLMADMNYFES